MLIWATTRGEKMLEGKALIEDTDMPVKMQIQAMASASEALDLFDVVDCKSIAAHIKKVTFFLLPSLNDTQNTIYAVVLSKILDISVQ